MSEPRHQRADPGDLTQPPHQRSQPDDNGAARPWAQPAYDQAPYHLMGPLFDGNDREFQPGETMTHWRPPRHRRHKIFLAAAYVAALLAVATVAGVLASSSAKPAASKSSAAAAVPPAAVTPAAPASSPATSRDNGVQTWWVSYGNPAFQQISQTMSQMRADATNAETTDDFSAVESDLTTAEGEIQAAQADPPIPDATLEQLWSTALADYASGVSEMLNGVQNNLDLSEITQGSAELGAGNTPMNTLMSEIVGLGTE